MRRTLGDPEDAEKADLMDEPENVEVEAEADEMLDLGESGTAEL